MRALAACLLALGLAASPALASNADPGGKDPAASPNNSSAAAQPANAPAPAANADPATKAAPSSMEVATELQQLRELLDAQAKQLQEQQQKMELLEEQLKAAGAARENLAAAPADPSASSSSAATAAVASNAALGGGAQEKAGPPTSITFKGITLTPGGFMVAESVWRQKALSADINSPLNANPFNGSSSAHMSEWNASGRQSRISMLIEGKLDNVKIGGYYEMDFLSAGTTSNDNQSNSYTMRQRQFWAQAALSSGWTFTGGQQWSLLTETTKGMDNRTEALPMSIDAQYVAGFSWARQFGFRVTKSLFDNKAWLGMSIEEAQTNAISVHGNNTAQATGATVACTAPGVGLCTAGGTITINTNPVFTNYLDGQFGASGGLYNPVANYAYNSSPDFVVKAVFEPGFGHYEVFGVISNFRDRIFPCITAPALAGCGGSATSGANAFNDNQVAGGGGANARWGLFNKHVDLGVHFFGGPGIGRYGSTGLPDATVNPAGRLVVLTNYQALGTLQFHIGKNLDIYTNYGGEYTDRAQFIKSGAIPNEGYGVTGLRNDGCFVEVPSLTGPATNNNTGVPTGVGGGTGFIPGALGNCNADTRTELEATLGFWYRFYSGPKGRVQFGMQYSNLLRGTWRGTNSNLTEIVQPHSDNNMVFTSFRYYLP